MVLGELGGLPIMSSLCALEDVVTSGGTKKNKTKHILKVVFFLTNIVTACLVFPVVVISICRILVQNSSGQYL